MNSELFNWLKFSDDLIRLCHVKILKFSSSVEASSRLRDEKLLLCSVNTLMTSVNPKHNSEWTRELLSVASFPLESSLQLPKWSSLLSPNKLVLLVPQLTAARTLVFSSPESASQKSSLLPVTRSREPSPTSPCRGHALACGLPLSVGVPPLMSPPLPLAYLA